MIGRPNRVGSVTRWTVSCNVECAPNNGKNCLGRPSRDAGHSRVPAPPHMIRGMIFEVTSTPTVAGLFPTQDAPSHCIEFLEEFWIARLRCGNQRIVEGTVGADRARLMF